MKRTARLLAYLSLAFILLAVDAARAQWTIENSGTTADLRGIFNVGGGVAWASGTNGTVLRTEDGGYLWQACAIPPGAEHLDFRGIQAFDANTAIVMSSGKGDLSRLYKTSDGCHTWKVIFTNPDPEGFWDAFVAGREGDEEPELLVFGDPVDGRFATFQTFGDEDGPQQLKKFDAGGLRAAPGEALFAASNSSMAINLDRLTGIFGTGGANGSRILVMCSSCEGDDGWRSVRLKHFVTGVSAGVFSVANFDLVWVAVGGDYLKPTEGTANSAFSVDDGVTWNLSSGFPHGYRSAVAYDADAKTWITVGPNGTDISTDDGKNWRALHPDAASHETSDADKNWNALSLPFAVGPHGRIGKLNPHALAPH
jgi:photosystem II stability/assembly factor-like uncharacterized protein